MPVRQGGCGAFPFPGNGLADSGGSPGRPPCMSGQSGFLKNRVSREGGAGLVRVPARGARMPDGAEAASRYDRAFDFFSMRGFPDIASGGGLSEAGLACFWRPRSGNRIAVSGGSGFWRRRLVQGVWFLNEPDWISKPCFRSPCRIKRPVESFEGGFSAM